VKVTTEQKFLFGPQAIGVDFQDHLCILIGDSLNIYNQQAKMIRTISAEPACDFCFDEQGNAYLYFNSSGNVRIDKYDSTGQLVGTMTNSLDTVIAHEGYEHIFMGDNIRFVPDVGLFLYPPTILIEFAPGESPDMTRSINMRNETYLSEDKYLKFSGEGKTIAYVHVFEEGQPVKDIRFEGVGIMSVGSVFSLDDEHEYYFGWTESPYTGEYVANILKYQGDELIYMTEVLPPNGIDYVRGKTEVVDSQGTIYAYCGSSKGIQIFRWVLK